MTYYKYSTIFSNFSHPLLFFPRNFNNSVISGADYSDSFSIITNVAAGKGQRKRGERSSKFVQRELPNAQPWRAPLPVYRLLFHREPRVRADRGRCSESRLRSCRCSLRIFHQNNRRSRAEQLWQLRLRELLGEPPWREPLPVCRPPFHREPGVLEDRGTLPRRPCSLEWRTPRGRDTRKEAETKENIWRCKEGKRRNVNIRVIRLFEKKIRFVIVNLYLFQVLFILADKIRVHHF